MDDLMVTINGEPLLISKSKLFQSLHGKTNLIIGHFIDNVIKKEKFITTNCLLIKQSLNEFKNRTTVQRYMESQSKIIFLKNLNLKDNQEFYFLVKTSKDIDNFDDYIKLLKFYSGTNKIQFGHYFSTKEIFVRPQFDRTIDPDVAITLGYKVRKSEPEPTIESCINILNQFLINTKEI